MRILIVEDDFLSRRILKEMLSGYGGCDLAVNVEEAIAAVEAAWDEDAPYDLITLDIRMPGLDGHQVLKAVRVREKEKGIYGLDMVSVIMVSTRHDAENIIGAFHKGLCDVYLIKPVDPYILKQKLAELGFQPIIHGSESLLRKRIYG